MNHTVTAHSGIVWHAFEDIDGRARQIAEQNNISPFLSKCLARLDPPPAPGRETDQFLHPCFEQLHDPMLMFNMQKATDRIRRAIDQNEPIRIVTDYDVDGTMSSLILQAALRILGHTDLTYHIPHRKIEGYGFSLIAAQKAVDDRVGLIITADIGVRDEESIAYAQSHGVDVIVLDHHLPEGCGVPKSAFTVVCPPQKDCRYPNPNLAACGISLKLAQAMLCDKKAYRQYIISMSKLAAMGTVADVVSLRDLENRAIVALGLKALNTPGSNNPGISALLNVSKLKEGQIDTMKIGYSLGPKINAAGRMASATHVIELINAKNSIIAQGLADQLNMMNERRKDIQEQMAERAEAELRDSGDAFLFAAFPESEFWQSGIVGIVAGRLRERFGKPVALGTIEGGSIVGSIRSTPGVHAVKALTSVAPYMEKFGGHRAAAGFRFKTENVEAVRKGLIQSAVEQLGGKVEIQYEEYVETMTPDDISAALFEDIKKLEPCGTGNPRPSIRLTGARLKYMKVCKNDSIRAVVPCCGIDLIAWIPAGLNLTPAELEKPVDLFGTLETDYFCGIQYTIRVCDVGMELDGDLR